MTVSFLKSLPYPRIYAESYVESIFFAFVSSATDKINMTNDTVATTGILNINMKM